jgi:hypothetical protein
MKTFFLPLLLLISIQLARGQTNHLEAVSSAGNSFTGSTIGISWNLGEVMTATFSGADYMFSQGFHQDFSAAPITSSSIVHATGSVSIYPNPVSDLLNISYEGNGNVQHQVQILTLDGRLLLETNYNTRHVVNLETYPSGYYIINLIDENKRVLETSKLVKH